MAPAGRGAPGERRMKRRVKRSMSIGAALLAFAAACPTSAQLPDFEERRREALDKTLYRKMQLYGLDKGSFHQEG